ncbi:receptor-like protein kinase, partial [Trifolium pratense]
MDTLQKIANESKLDEGLIQSFNSGVNFSKGSGIVFIPGRVLVLRFSEKKNLGNLKFRWVIKMEIMFPYIL